ncbi:glycoside hydrolase family 113, partial [Jejuia pallidilutea]|uniref:glycoside hydrolase family 113 n=1 Tax=Jejuia pallidilutea TaxID=504487 RepID=UPI001EE74F0B
WKLVHGKKHSFGRYHTYDRLVQKTNASWVSLSPGIGISDKSEQFPPVRYEFPVSAEIEKMKVIIPKIINSGITNIMLKPLTSFGDIGVNNSGFWGDFYVDTEEKWKEVESAYTDLFYEFANLSNEFPEVKLLSVGNELKEFTTRRPEFFKVLILKIKADFPDLQLTYAANWNEYQSVSFWDDLDFIGVNPYFPLINKETPTVDEVKQALVPIKNDLTELSCSNQKPILFTEYGYRSIDFGAWEAWNLGDVTTSNHNFETQNNAYIAFYDVFWGEDWVAGGFFWEWKVLFNGEVNNPNENGWTINDKPVEEIIRDQYKG